MTDAIACQYSSHERHGNGDAVYIWRFEHPMCHRYIEYPICADCDDYLSQSVRSMRCRGCGHIEPVGVGHTSSRVGVL